MCFRSHQHPSEPLVMHGGSGGGGPPTTSPAPDLKRLSTQQLRLKELRTAATTTAEAVAAAALADVSANLRTSMAPKRHSGARQRPSGARSPLKSARYTVPGRPRAAQRRGAPGGCSGADKTIKIKKNSQKRLAINKENGGDKKLFAVCGNGLERGCETYA